MDVSHAILAMVNSSVETNLGDRVIHKTLVAQLTPYGQITAFNELRDGRVKGRSPFFLARLLRFICSHVLAPQTHTYLVLPPGQGLQTPWSALPRVVAQIACLWLLYAMGVRIIRLGYGLAVDGAITRLKEKWTSRLCHIYTVRDGDGLMRAREWGIRNANWFPDLSWLVPLPRVTKLLPFRERRTVVLCFRGSREGDQQDSDLSASLLSTLGDLLSETKAAGYTDFLLVQHDDNDRAMAETIAERYGAIYCLRVRTETLRPSDIQQIYRAAALVFSNRLHALLLGLQFGAVGIPVADTSFQIKLRDQYREIGIEDLIVDISEPTTWRKTVRSAVESQSVVASAVSTYRSKCIDAARRDLDAIFRE